MEEEDVSCTFTHGEEEQEEGTKGRLGLQWDASNGLNAVTQVLLPLLHLLCLLLLLLLLLTWVTPPPSLSVLCPLTLVV